MPNIIPAIKFTAHTTLNYSPRKSRLIINTIRGQDLNSAIANLMSNGRPKSKKIFDLIKSAASNLKLTEEEFGDYKIETIVVEEAQRLYRMMPRARGSSSKIRRRYSRIKILVSPVQKA